MTRTNAKHLDAVIEQSSRLARAIGSWTNGQTDCPMTAATVGHIAGELLSMTLVLARSADAPAEAADRERRLAAIHCSEVPSRLAGLWQGIEVQEDIGADGQPTSGEWLDDIADLAGGVCAQF